MKRYICPDCRKVAYMDILAGNPVQYSIYCSDQECDYNHIFTDHPSHLSRQIEDKETVNGYKNGKITNRACYG